MKSNRTEYAKDVDKDKVRNLFDLEADLYRAMWLSCLILLSLSNSLKRDHQSFKRRKTEFNNSTGDARNRKIVLQSTVRQCQLLVRFLEKMELQPQSKGKYDDYTAIDKDGVKRSKNKWDGHILKWTNDNCDEEDQEHDDDSLNILSFTEEQLEKEEQQLLYMAATPIPIEYPHRLQQKQYSSSNGGANVNSIETNRQFIGRLLTNAAETWHSVSSVPIELNDRGVLRVTNGSIMDKCTDMDKEMGKRWWWSLTSQSSVLSDHNESPNVIQINNVISSQNADLTTITLDVGRESIFWQEQVFRIKASTDRQSLAKLVEEQEEIATLWPVNEVIAAQIKARELFVGEIFEAK